MSYWCNTCKYEDYHQDIPPCDKCYPTTEKDNWESKEREQ